MLKHSTEIIGLNASFESIDAVTTASSGRLSSSPTFPNPTDVSSSKLRSKPRPNRQYSNTTSVDRDTNLDDISKRRFHHSSSDSIHSTQSSSLNSDMYQYRKYWENLVNEIKEKIQAKEYKTGLFKTVTHTDCFPGSEVVSILTEKVKLHPGVVAPRVTAKNLCQKFLETSVLFPVCNNCNENHHSLSTGSNQKFEVSQYYRLYPMSMDNSEGETGMVQSLYSSFRMKKSSRVNTPVRASTMHKENIAPDKSPSMKRSNSLHSHLQHISRRKVKSKVTRDQEKIYPASKEVKLDRKSSRSSTDDRNRSKSNASQLSDTCIHETSNHLPNETFTCNAHHHAINTTSTSIKKSNSKSSITKKFRRLSMKLKDGVTRPRLPRRSLMSLHEMPSKSPTGLPSSSTVISSRLDEMNNNSPAHAKSSPQSTFYFPTAPVETSILKKERCRTSDDNKNKCMQCQTENRRRSSSTLASIGRHHHRDHSKSFGDM